MAFNEFLLTYDEFQVKKDWLLPPEFLQTYGGFQVKKKVAFTPRIPADLRWIPRKNKAGF
jgi:hypothetical protein